MCVQEKEEDYWTNIIKEKNSRFKSLEKCTEGLCLVGTAVALKIRLHYKFVILIAYLCYDAHPVESAHAQGNES